MTAHIFGQPLLNAISQFTAPSEFTGAERETEVASVSISPSRFVIVLTERRRLISS